QVRGALEIAPDLTAVHDVLAGFHAAELQRAERQHRPNDAARAEAFLRRHDRGRFAHVLSGMGAVTVMTDPPGARVTAWRMERQQRRWVPVRDRVLGTTPLEEVPLPFGSWLLTLERDGYETVRYPASLGRGEHWDGVGPGDRSPTPVHLPHQGSLNAEDRYMPAGWAWAGGDPDAADGLPLRRLWVDALVVRAVPVTVSDYLVFLRGIAESEGVGAARALAPRESQSRAPVDASVVGLREGEDGFGLASSADGLRWHPRHPITLVDWHAAQRYAAWLADETGLGWRLPNELEWEKAARGVDGRRLVWGETLEPTWANVLGHSRGAAALDTVDRFPEDCSIYGVRGLMGNVRDRCINLWQHEGPAVVDGRVQVDAADPADPSWRSARGGSWTSAPNLGRPASRFADLPAHRSWALGFRLVRPVG
ncbi:MAG: sulfatase activating formylglycine-generating enzyme, partial [Myxococcota bacterium]